MLTDKDQIQYDCIHDWRTIPLTDGTAFLRRCGNCDAQTPAISNPIVGNITVAGSAASLVSKMRDSLVMNNLEIYECIHAWQPAFKTGPAVRCTFCYKVLRP